MQELPKPLRLDLRWGKGRQLDQMDTTSCPGKKALTIGFFVVGGVSQMMNDALVGVCGLRSWSEAALAYHARCVGVDKSAFEGLKVQAHECSRDTPRPCENRWI